MLPPSSQQVHSKQKGTGQSGLNGETIRFWITAILLLALLGYAMHWYFEYWNRNLWLRWRAARAAASHSERAELLRLRGKTETA